MTEKLKPMHDNILVRRHAADKTTKGGIVLAESAQEKNLRGEVLAVGPGRINERGMRIEPDVRVGDVVVLAKYSGNEIEIDGERYLLVRDGEIAAIVETP